MSHHLPNLKTRLFTPLWISQSLSAMNDNIFRQGAITLLILSTLSMGRTLANLSTALFVVPFFLFSATAGSMADRYPKAYVMRVLRFIEIFVFALAGYALVQQNVALIAISLFVGGTVATFYGPLKVAVLPELLPKAQLIGANGLFEAGLFLAILAGTIFGSMAGQHLAIIIIALLLSTLAAFALSWLVPIRPAAAPDIKIDWNIVRTTKNILSENLKNRTVRRVLLGISWFWFIGTCFITQFADFVHTELHALPEISTLFLGLFSIGIAFGSLACHKLLRGEVTAKFVPLSSLLMTIFMIDLFFSSNAYTSLAIPEPQTLSQFLHTGVALRIIFDLTLISFFAGLYIVPLTTMMQTLAAPENRARLVAAGNVLDAALMTAASLIGTMLIKMSFNPSAIFLVVGILNGAVALYICRLLPHDTVKGFFATLLRIFYRIEVRGLENLQTAGDRAVIVVNHLSFLDGLLLGAFLPGKILFAVHTEVAKRWWVKPFLSFVDFFPMDPTQPMAAKGFIRAIQGNNGIGQRGVIFPEGRLTVTGALMKIYEGPGLIALKSEAPLVPVWIDGLQYTPFSRMGGKWKLRWFPTLTINILPPQRFDISPDLKGRKKREMISLKLYDIMAEMIFASQNKDQTLFDALLDARAVHGGGTKILEDASRKPINYDRLIIGSLVLGRQFKKLCQNEKNIGILLPNSIGFSLAFWGLQSQGKAPALLNFTAGAQNIQNACNAADIKTIITSRAFIEKGKFDNLIDALKTNQRIIYLEDIKQNITSFNKAQGWLTYKTGFAAHCTRKIKPEQIAAILFTSGSEGTPKGVALSHRNIIANGQQIRARIDFTGRDILFNALPSFHSFGLTAGTLLPTLAGVFSFQYPSPLHYRVVVELAYAVSATIFFGTDTFLNGYARVANPYDFYNIRYVFAGAEKLRDETRRAWEDKFGLRIFEGYGITETAPVLAINTPMYNRVGTVGRLLPGIDHKLIPVPGIDDGGQLWVRGPNVMLGYLKTDHPGILQTPPAPDFGIPPSADHWHDTGDIVTIDTDGFVRIVGRVKRFAKIAGEMISLGAVEDMIITAWPDSQHAVIAVPDARKGEALILITTKTDLTQDQLTDALRQHRATELMIPKQITTRDELPLLGTGKIDYVSLKKQIEQAA